MNQHKLEKYWWLPLLAAFDFIYYYLIQYLTSQGAAGIQVTIRWEGVFFIFLISLVSVACVRWVQLRVEKFAVSGIPAKYLQILLFSFALFLLITAGSQFLFEYAAGQQRTLEYIIGHLIIYIFLHIIVGNAAIAVAYFRESAALKQDLLGTEKAKAESELRVLQQQMSPHFLFNNLNTLASLIPQDPDKAVSFTQDLSTVFRYVSQNAKQDLIPLSAELDFLSRYMALLEYRFGAAYTVEKHLKNLDTHAVLAVPLALQVLIENVIKHNSGSRSNPLKVEIVAAEVHISIRNEIRTKLVSGNQESGIGLKNLQDRYQLATGRSISYEAIDGYFVVKLPLIKIVEDARPDH